MPSAQKRSFIRRFATGLLKFAGISAAFVTVMLVSGYFTMRLALQGRQVTVPEVAGMTLEEAGERLAGMDLILAVAAEKYNDRLEAGRVLAQEPPAGAGIKKYRKVKVIASLGPKLFTIPDLGGQLLRSALIRLEAEGLRPGRVVHAHTRAADTERIVSQDPPPQGESLGHGGVSLLVSKGPRAAVYVMPDLTGQPLREARSLLERYGFKVGAVRREPHAWMPLGAITRQSPRVGHPVTGGDTISLVISG